MNQALDTLKDLTPAQLTTHLQEMAPAVLEAKAAYDALIREQRLYTAARELLTDGVWVGDMVQVEDTGSTPHRVELNVGGYVHLQPYVRGKAAGLPIALWEVGRITRIDQ